VVTRRERRRHRRRLGRSMHVKQGASDIGGSRSRRGGGRRARSRPAPTT
jgi:hypothetical protein